jgi:hypothetical protein
MKNIAALAFFAGFLLTLFAGFNFVTREKVVDIGSVEIFANKNHSFAWSPILGIVLIVVGGGVYIGLNKKGVKS